MLFTRRLAWLALLVFAGLAMADLRRVATAQSAVSAMSVTGYPGAMAMVQDPPGSAWKPEPTANLPAPAAVLQYKEDQWVQILAGGRPVRISIMNVQVAGEPGPGDVRPCPQGQYAAEGAGSSGLGGC